MTVAQADGKRLVWVSRIAVLGWAVFMGAVMCVAQVCNLNVNWCASHAHGSDAPAARCCQPSSNRLPPRRLLLIIGVFAGGAVWPLILLITWDRATGKAAISGVAPD